MNQISFSRYTSINPNRLSKRFTLAGDILLKEGGGNMQTGIAERLTVASLAEFAELLPTLKPNQATSYGINGHDRAKVVVKELVEKAQVGSELPVIARTRDYLHWPAGAGLLMLDYDPPADGPALARDELIAALVEICPALEGAPMIWRPSASSCIYKGDEELKGIGGQRLYVPVLDASDIPRAGQALFNRAWLYRHGRYDLSKSGAFLARSIVDGSVFQPERLDFCGGASCGKGLVQRLPAPILINPDAPYLDSRLILDLDAKEKQHLADIQDAYRGMLADEQAKVREAWIGQRVDQRLKDVPEDQHETERPKLEKVYREAAEGGRLGLAFELTVKAKGAKTAKVMTVGDLLRNRAQFHEGTTLDPLEPDYPEGQARYVGWLNLNAREPYLQSQAHGGSRYALGAIQEAPPSPSDEDAYWESLMNAAATDTQVGEKEKSSKTLGSVVDLLSAPPWAGVIGFNQFSQRIEKRAQTPYKADPGAWVDVDTAETMLHLERTTGTAYGRDLVDLAVMTIAHRNAFNPAQDRLRALAGLWDGTARLTTWLVEFLNAKASEGNADYLAEIGDKWLKGVAARVFFPGCKRDDVLVLRGPQGWKKSTAAQAVSDAILPDAFTDSVDLGNLPEAKIQIRGIIVAELGELAGMRKAEVESIKAFVSAKSDHFREKFGRYAQDFPRTVSFIGSTNDQTFLKDPTGNRRWWPVTLSGPIDTPRLTAILPQLLGEAAQRVLQGEPWHVTAEKALEQADRVREAHFEEDVWTDPVMKIVDDIESGKAARCPRCKGSGYIENTSQPHQDDPGRCFKCDGSGKLGDNADRITITTILDALDIPRGQQNVQSQHRVGAILRFNGYEEARHWLDRKNNRYQRYWKKSPMRVSMVPMVTAVTDRQEADKTRNHYVTTGVDPMVTPPSQHPAVTIESAQWLPSGYGESLGKQGMEPLEPLEPLDSYTGKNENDNSLATRILNLLRGSPAGFTQDEIIRQVGNAKGASPAMIELTLTRLAKEGAISRLNGKWIATGGIH